MRMAFPRIAIRLAAATTASSVLLGCVAAGPSDPPGWIRRCERDLQDPAADEFQKAAAAAMMQALYDDVGACRSTYPEHEPFLLYLLYGRDGKLIDSYADPPTVASRCFRFRAPDVDARPPGNQHCFRFGLSGERGPRHHEPESRE